MTLSLGIFTFINAWWIMLFFVLPFRGDKPRWKRLLVINSAVSLLVTIVLALLIHYNVVPLKELAGE